MEPIVDLFNYTVVECNYDSELFKRGETVIWPRFIFDDYMARHNDYDPDEMPGWREVPVEVAYAILEEFNAKHA